MIRGGSHVCPPSVVRENTVGPVNPRSRLCSRFPTRNRVTSPGGALIRSQTAYTNLASVGSAVIDRKSTRLNSSHSQISYAVFCLKKKKKHKDHKSISLIYVSAHRALQH